MLCEDRTIVIVCSNAQRHSKAQGRRNVGLIELFIIGVGLSMDAFAASVCKGLGMKCIDWKQAFVLAIAFGAFQALMPLAGYFLGTQFATFVEPVDHWITFILLAIIGGKMIWDGIHDKDESESCDDSSKLKVSEVLMLAIATSIDAFAVGCSFAFVQVNIGAAIVIIGLTTFVLCLFGVILGNKFGTRYNKPATILGGAVLVLIGLKTLLEHLGVIAF